MKHQKSAIYKAIDALSWLYLGASLVFALLSIWNPRFLIFAIPTFIFAMFLRWNLKNKIKGMNKV